MPNIHLTTLILAPVERVFDLSRSINLHKISVAHTEEKVIAGITGGLIKENETVTWQAKHLFKVRQFTSKVTAMKVPEFFTDEMTKGDFKRFIHQHHFKAIDNGTIMIDTVEFESPYGIIGRLLNAVCLEKYIKGLLLKRNEVIKEYAESNKWKVILNN